MPLAAPRTLQVVTPKSQKAAERVYCRGARRAYRRAWAVLLQRLPELQEVKKATIDEGLLDDVGAELVSGLDEAGLGAAGVISAEQGATTYARYKQMFEPIGGFKGISDTMAAGIISTVEEWYRDPEQDMGDLSAALQNWFAPWRADMVGITETTRMGAAATAVQADALGAQTKIWATSEDDVVCEECADLDGQSFDVGDPEGDPPLHPGCRCGSSIVLPGDEEMADTEGEGEAADEEEVA